MHRCHQTVISHPFMVRAHQSSEFDPSRKLSVHKEVQEGYLLLYYSSSNTFTRFSNNLQNFQLNILIIFQNIMVLVWAWKPWSNNKTFSSNILFGKLNTEWLNSKCVLLFIMAIINVLGKLYACVMSSKFSFFSFFFFFSSLNFQSRRL